VSVGIALALIAGASLGAAQAQDVQPTRQRKAVDPDKPICRTEAETGSRFTRRVCRSSAEWPRIDAANGSAATDAMRRNRTGAQ